jgi:polyketide synthase PksN
VKRDEFQTPDARQRALYAAPAWAPARRRPVLKLAVTTRRQVVLCGVRGVNELQLEALLANSQCTTVVTDDGKGFAERYSEAAVACFELIRRALEDKSSNRTLVQVVVADTPEDSLLLGLGGLLRTAAIENPRISAQVVLVPADIGAQALADVLQAENTGVHENVVRHGQGTRQVLRLRELEASAPEELPAFKQHGVYLITGGLGGLGLLFAQEILKQAGDATIVLTGRSALSDEKKHQLEAFGGQVTYRPLDVADADEVQQLVREVVAAHGQLNGIIHAAGVRSDSFILKKAPQEFAQVLSPKVAGTLNLDEATRELDLDFLVLFSSGASVMGNSGQADYAAANGFMDQFARYRNELAAQGQRRGRTLAINWPLWQDGGMGVDAEIQEWFERAYGIQPLATLDGLRAFHDGLNTEAGQMLVVAGDVPKLRRNVLAECASREALAEEQIEEQLAAMLGGSCPD